MTANPMRKFLDLLRGTALLQEGKEPSDGQLLTRFVEGRDALALETLVRRHAPMVWSVCRRNLTRHDDAEDAFQATFLVFLRKAASLRARELLANWLHGVAYQTCRKARQTAAKGPVPLPTPEPPLAAADDAFGPELLTQLDRELSRLPEKYRSAIVLCHLQGKSLRDAAQQMRVAEGTIGSRLARGRQMLARRLGRPGVTVPATSVAAVLTEQAVSAAVPAALCARTIQAVGQLAAGAAVTDGPLSSGASTLADGVLQSLAVAKEKTVAVWLLLVTLVLGSAAAAYYSLAGPPPEQKAQTTKGSGSEDPPAAKPALRNRNEPDPDKDGTVAGATNSAKNHLRDHLSTLPITIGLFTYNLFGHWPSQDIHATFDPASRHWTLTGSCRCDVPAGLPYKREDGWPDTTKEWDCREKEWNVVLAYNSSARTYEVKTPANVDKNCRLGGRPARKDDFARWLLGVFPEPKPSNDPVTALHLVVEAPEPTKLGLKPNYTYGKKELTAEPTPRGVSVRVDNGSGPSDQWLLHFGGPLGQSLKVGKYGGAYVLQLLNPENGAIDPVGILTSPGPVLFVKHSLLDGGKPASAWICHPGEFVVWEIEVKEKRVVRLAIDFIADTEYSRPATAKRDTRHIVRGSLRYSSLLQPSAPKLAADAKYYSLTDPAPAGLRGMKFVPLPKGTFYMGWNGTKGSAKKTEIKEDFEIAVYTVTQGQWRELMWNNPSWFSRQGGGKEAVKAITDEDLKQLPVERVCHDDVLAFIKKLNEREKDKGYVYRLPTAAEWEYACRGGATTEEECSYQFYLEKPTNDLSSMQANFNGNRPFGKGEKGPYLKRTTKVGSYKANRLGLYDMHGNVWQYTSTGGLRGGGWYDSAETCRAISSASDGTSPFGLNRRPESIGFRLVRVPAR